MSHQPEKLMNSLFKDAGKIQQTLGIEIYELYDVGIVMNQLFKFLKKTIDF